MQSKRSSFNKTLFLKNLTRFWPLWGGAALMGSLAPVFLLIQLLNGYVDRFDHLDFATMLYGVLTSLAPAFTAVYAVLCAMAVWNYLYTARSVGLLHALPIHRTGLFLTNALSGLAMLLIPYAAVGLQVCLIALFCGAMDILAVAQTVLGVALLALLFFGIATLCAMCTGTLLALPVFYAIINFLAWVVECMVVIFARNFIFGMPSNHWGVLSFLSPVLEIYDKFDFESIYSYSADGFRQELQAVELHGLWVVALYGLAGLGLLAVSWLLYRRRHSESAGDVVAVGWLKPVFRYGVALCAALTLGQLLFILFFDNVGRQADPGRLIPMAVCMVFAGLLGDCAASMLLQKSLRVFRDSWKGALVVCAGVLALCLAMYFDVLGIATRIPALEDIETLELDTYGETIYLEGEEDQALMAQVLDLHQAIIDDRDYAATAWELNWSMDREDISNRQVTIHYWLEDGSLLHRSYDLTFTGDRWEDESTYDGKLHALFTERAVLLEQVEAPEGATLNSVYVHNGYSGYSDVQSESLDPQRLYEALLRDAEEGNIPCAIPDPGQRSYSYDVSIELEFDVREQNDYTGYYTYKRTDLYPSMLHTLQALLDMGYMTAGDLTLWNEKLSERLGETAMAFDIPTASATLAP